MTHSISLTNPQSSASRVALFSITLGVVIVPLNSTMIAVALPEIMRDLEIEMNAAGWLVTAYLITMVVFQLVAGPLGDRWGRRRSVFGGMIYFGFASLVAALSPNLESLLIARVQQAIAGAFLSTNGLALAYEIVPPDRRGSDLGLLNAAVVLMSAGGPPIGGLLISLAGWRSIFWVNLPLVLAALILGWSSLPATTPSQHARRLDSPGTLSLFQDRTFASANAAILLMNLAIYMMFLTTPILLSRQVGWSSLQTGLLLAAMFATLALCSPIGGRLSDIRGKRLANVIGLSMLTLGLFLMTMWNGIPTPSFLLICLGLAGAGVGLSSISLQTAALESANPNQTGAASGISATSRYLGNIVGSGILTGLSGSIQVGNFKLIFLIATLAALGAVLMSLGIRNSKKYLASL